MIENKKLKMSVKKEEYVSELIIKDDPYKMNWVIEDTYLQQAGYQDMDKLFGLFDITADGEKTGSEAVNPVIKEEQSKIEIGYNFEKFNNRSKNSLTSIGDGMNCTFEHVCSNS